MEYPGNERLPTITVVLTTHDCHDGVLKALGGLSRQVSVDFQDLDVIVVADGCPTASADALRIHPTPFRMTIIEQAHSGPAAARNRGLASAVGDIVLFLDDDVIPDPQTIATHRTFHMSGSNVVVLGAIEPSRGRRSPWEAYDDAMREKRQLALRTFERPAGIHSARNISARREFIVAMGGFRGHLPGNQEVELGYRLRQAGARFVFSAEASAVDNSCIDYEAWRARQSMRGKLDVATYNQSPGGQGLDRLFACFRERHALGRAVVVSLLRHRRAAPHVIGWAQRIADSAYGVGLRAVSRAGYSVIANTLYWGGVRDAVRGNNGFFSLLKAARYSPGLTTHASSARNH